MASVKKTSKKRESGSKGFEKTAKKAKRQDFTEIEFKELLKKPASVSDALIRFIEQVKLFPAESQYDLIAKYCQLSSDCSDLLQVLESLSSNEKPDQDDEQKKFLVFEVLQLILMRIADDLVQYTSAGSVIARRLLKTACLQCILGQLKSHNKVEHIKSALLLLTTLTSVSPSAASQVMTQFDVISNHLLKLLYRKHDPADVKSGVIQFVVSFFLSGDSNVIRQLLNVKGFLNTVISGLREHRADIIVLMLTALHDKVVCNSNMTKTTKIRLFNDSILTAICQLLMWRTSPVHADHQQSKRAANYVQFAQMDLSGLTTDQLTVRVAAYTLLVSLCTSVKNGIIFHDKMFASTAQNANHVLTNFLMHLRSPHLDPLARELVVNSLVACPDVLQWYLPSLQQACALRPTQDCLSVLRFIRQIYESQPLVTFAIKINKVTSAYQLAEVIVSSLVPPKDIWNCFLSAIKSKQVRTNKTKNEGDEVGDERLVPTAIEHEAFAMLLLVLKRTAATLKHIQLHSPWGPMSSTVVNIIGDSITKVCPPGHVIIEYWMLITKKKKVPTATLR